jgi:hypothetical protein
MNLLLVEPNFPKACKSKNHNGFMPIGLLKLASYHRKQGDAICIVRGEISREDIWFEHPNGSKSRNRNPDKIFITSYFTYWALYLKNSVLYYKNLYPKTRIVVGGIYASLMPEHCKKYTECDEVFIGVHKDAENCPPALTYLEKHYGKKDYQIIHTSRGCIRRCNFCGVYKIEPEFTYKSSIEHEIVKQKIIFYDNNLLANPNIENILAELSYLKEKKKIKWCEAQSGIDGRILEKRPHIAFLLKEAGFKDIRISWDGPVENGPRIRKQLDIIKSAGYNLQEDVYVFMIYNWDIPFEEMEQKRLKCWEWKVQISDCRYRPLDQTFDRYNGQKFRKGQTSRDYYIHKTAGWSDKKVRTFRNHIRSQNICIRLNIQFYSNAIERSHLNNYVSKELIYFAKYCPKEEIIPKLDALKIPYWFPENFNGNGYHLTKEQIYQEFEEITNKLAISKGVESSDFKQWRNKIQREFLTRGDKEITICR